MSKAKKSASGRKRERRALASLKQTQQALNNEAQLPPSDDDANYVIHPSNSLIKLTGKEPRVRLKTGQWLVRCDKLAIISLEEYDQLLEATGLLNRLINQQRAADGQKRMSDALKSKTLVVPTAAEAQAIAQSKENK